MLNLLCEDFFPHMKSKFWDQNLNIWDKKSTSSQTFDFWSWNMDFFSNNSNFLSQYFKYPSQIQLSPQYFDILSHNFVPQNVMVSTFYLKLWLFIWKFLLFYPKISTCILKFCPYISRSWLCIKKNVQLILKNVDYLRSLNLYMNFWLFISKPTVLQLNFNLFKNLTLS